MAHGASWDYTAEKRRIEALERKITELSRKILALEVKLTKAEALSFHADPEEGSLRWYKQVNDG